MSVVNLLWWQHLSSNEHRTKAMESRILFLDWFDCRHLKSPWEKLQKIIFWLIYVKLVFDFFFIDDLFLQITTKWTSWKLLSYSINDLTFFLWNYCEKTLGKSFFGLILSIFLSLATCVFKLGPIKYSEILFSTPTIIWLLSFEVSVKTWQETRFSGLAIKRVTILNKILEVRRSNDSV